MKSMPPKSSRPHSSPPAPGRLLPVCIALFLASVLGVLWLRFSERPRPRRPDIFLISIDTLRADRLGCYGHAAAQTATIDRLAAEGVVFEAVVSPAPITLPSHASMLTGLVPARHGARDNGDFRLREEFETLAESLRAGGYQTGAFIGGFPLDRTAGLDQGFERYDDEMPERTVSTALAVRRKERDANDVFDAAAGWLKHTDADNPVFAFIHLYDPHSPYEQALPGAQKDTYDGEVAYVDRALGSFLDSLGASDRWKSLTLIVTSDHGEGLGQHHEQTHSLFVYESTLRVPLILHGLEGGSPRRVAEPVGLVDIAPTILEIAGAPPWQDVDGVPLPTDARGSGSDNRPLYFESLFGELRFGWAPLRGIRSGSLKLISAPRPELYDLSNDPGELRNLLPQATSLAQPLLAELERIPYGLLEQTRHDAARSKALESLGYISAPPVQTDTPDALPDPKDRIDAYEGLTLAHQEILRGKHDDGLARYESLERFFEKSPNFYRRWADTAALTGRWTLAISVYRKAVSLEPDRESTWLNLGVAHLKSNQPGEAVQIFERLFALNPDHPQGHLYAGLAIKRHRGDSEAAVSHWQRFLEIAPDHPQANEARRAIAGERKRDLEQPSTGQRDG